MSRLTRKIQALSSQLSDLEGQLQDAQDKQDRQNFKRRRKAYRKKLINDPMARMMAKMEHEMFTPAEMPAGGYVGLLQALTPSFCSDCTCGKAEGCR